MSYLQRAGSLTSNRQARLSAMQQIIERYQPNALATNSNALRLAWSRYYVAVAEHYRAELNYAQAAKSHFAAFKANPTSRLAKALAADVLSLLNGHRQYWFKNDFI
jgi:hypothetical protein